MRLATITNWAYGVTVALTLASGCTMLLASSAQDRERGAIVAQDTLDRATSMVDEDVAQLSSLARQVAIGGSSADLVAYRREAQRLDDVEARTRRIRDAGATAGELQTLRDALGWADALRDQQEAAIAAIADGHRGTATDILFSPQYERELDRIASTVARFQDRIDQRTSMAVAAARDAAERWRAVAEFVLALTGLVFLCVLFFVFRQRVLRPVVRLSDVVTRLAAQDYAAEPPYVGQVDEIGDMAQALSIFRENGIARQQLERQRDADRDIRDVLSRMTQRMQGCDSVRDLIDVVALFAPTVTPNVAGRLYLLDQTRNAMIAACTWSGTVHSDDAFAPLACWGLRRGRAHRPGGAHLDVPCHHIAPDGERSRDTLCVPLAGRNGLLGLLYLEQVDALPNAAADDLYIRMLAETISLALDNLRLRDALRDMAMVDPLTGLANRRGLDATLPARLAEAEAAGALISCAMIDVDHFKRFNDEHGHDAGDAVLRAVGQALAQSVRAEDDAFRVGGEEFLVLMPGLAADAAIDRAEHLRAKIETLRMMHDGRDLGPVTVSIGVASAPDQCAAEQVAQAADSALLRAKRAGRNRVTTVQRRTERRTA